MQNSKCKINFELLILNWSVRVASRREATRLTGTMLGSGKFGLTLGAGVRLWCVIGW